MTQLFSVGSVSANFTAVTVSFDGTSYLYSVEFTVPANGPNGTVLGTINCSLTLKHTPGAGATTYSGVAQYGFDDGANLLAGTTRHRRTSTTDRTGGVE